MTVKCYGSKHCKNAAYKEIAGGVCLKDIIEKADERDSVAKRDYHAVVKRDSDGKIISMNLTVGGKTWTYPLGRGGSKGRPDIPEEVVFDALKGCVSDEAYDKYTRKYKAKSAKRKEGTERANKRADERADGHFIPSVVSKLCVCTGSNSQHPLCIFNEFTGCSRSALLQVNGLSCWQCLLGCCECEFDSYSRELENQEGNE
jgi:hypothetical protein